VLVSGTFSRASPPIGNVLTVYRGKTYNDPCNQFVQTRAFIWATRLCRGKQRAFVLCLKAIYRCWRLAGQALKGNPTIHRQGMYTVLRPFAWVCAALDLVLLLFSSVNATTSSSPSFSREGWLFFFFACFTAHCIDALFEMTRRRARRCTRRSLTVSNLISAH
jgi:hypothetical protein